jgi:hypothetical protein
MDQDLNKENIIKILGIESLPEERKVQIVNQATELVLKRLMIRMLETLDEVKQKEFATVLEKGEQQGIAGFIQTNVPNFPQWMSEELQKIKEDLKANKSE